MSVYQNCICFSDNISNELLDYISSLNISNLSTFSNNTIEGYVEDEDEKKYPIEYILIFGIIFLMIFVFFVISKIMKNKRINPYSQKKVWDSGKLKNDNDNDNCDENEYDLIHPMSNV